MQFFQFKCAMARQTQWWNRELGKKEQECEEEFAPTPHLLVKRKVSDWLLEEAENLHLSAPKGIKPEDVARKRQHLITTAQEMKKQGDTQWVYKPLPKDQFIKLPTNLSPDR